MNFLNKNFYWFYVFLFNRSELVLTQNVFWLYRLKIMSILRQFTIDLSALIGEKMHSNIDEYSLSP